MDIIYFVVVVLSVCAVLDVCVCRVLSLLRMYCSMAYLVESFVMLYSKSVVGKREATREGGSICLRRPHIK